MSSTDLTPEWLLRVVGSLGISAAMILFLSPAPTIRRIAHEKNILEYSQLPYLAQIVESSFWLLWALSVGERLEVVVCNIIAVSIMVLYVLVFSVFTPNGRRKRMSLELMLATLLIGAGIAFKAVGSNLLDDTTLATVLSSTALVLNIVKYASPMCVARLVIRTKSNEFMPLALTLACLLCSSLWTTYGSLLQDVWIIVPNAAGVACAILQAALWLRYRAPKETSDKFQTAASVELKEVKCTEADRKVGSAAPVEPDELTLPTPVITASDDGTEKCATADGTEKCTTAAPKLSAAQPPKLKRGMSIYNFFAT